MKEISREQLQEAIKSINEETADEFMTMALTDTKKLLSGNISKEEVAYKLYRAYLMGYALGQNKE